MKSTQVLLALILGVSTCFSQLTQQERAQFVNNGVDVTSLGPLNWQFAHSGLPSQDVVDQVSCMIFTVQCIYHFLQPQLLNALFVQFL